MSIRPHFRTLNSQSTLIPKFQPLIDFPPIEPWLRLGNLQGRQQGVFHPSLTVFSLPLPWGLGDGARRKYDSWRPKVVSCLTSVVCGPLSSSSRGHPHGFLGSYLAHSATTIMDMRYGSLHPLLELTSGGGSPFLDNRGPKSFCRVPGMLFLLLHTGASFKDIMTWSVFLDLWNGDS